MDKMRRKNMEPPSLENVEKAINELETMGHKYLPLFLEAMNTPEVLNNPVGPNKNCLSLESARQYVEHSTDNKKGEISNSAKEHVESCTFCGDLVEQIPKPKVTTRLREKIKEKIEGQEAQIVHTRNINQFVKSICLEFSRGLQVSDVIKESVSIDDEIDAIKEVLIEDCDGDKKEELKIVLDKKSLGKRRLFQKRHKLAGVFRDGTKFYVHAKR